jgi:hypothetical protein
VISVLSSCLKCFCTMYLHMYIHRHFGIINNFLMHMLLYLHNVRRNKSLNVPEQLKRLGHKFRFKRQQLTYPLRLQVLMRVRVWLTWTGDRWFWGHLGSTAARSEQDPPDSSRLPINFIPALARIEIARTLIFSWLLWPEDGMTHAARGTTYRVTRWVCEKVSQSISRQIL